MPRDNDLPTGFRSEAGFCLTNFPSRCYWIGITDPKGCSGISNLRKAHRRTTYQRVFSSKCSAVDFSHRKNAATVPSARWISSDSACVEVRGLERD